MSASIETVSSASLNGVSPVSTLAKQGAGPLGQRLVIGVQANSACCLEGGVEAILKANHSDVISTESSAETVRAEAAAGEDFDAFAFLHENRELASCSSDDDGIKKKGIGGFFRKVAASASTTLERQMQGLAVKIDQGRNPDLLRFAMYDCETNDLLDLTEAMPMPNERQDFRFQIPLILPASHRQKSVIFKLWIQSGATLLQSTKAAKNFLLAQVTVDSSKLVIGVQRLPLVSKLIVAGELELCVHPDPKFPVPYVDRAWNLTEPEPHAYMKGMNYLPLDRSYSFEGKRQSQWLFATERASESTVVLPVAAAVMEMAARACLKSLHHAQSVTKALRVNRHDSKDPSKSTCLLSISGVETSTSVTTPGALSVSWRRPDSMFELELISNQSIPVLSADAVSRHSPLQVTFYPKICTHDILPGVLNACGGRLPPQGYLLGDLHFFLKVPSADHVDILEATISIERLANNQSNTLKVPLLQNGVHVGNICLTIQVSLPTEKPKFANIPCTDGLVSLVGLESLLDGVNPVIDTDVRPSMDSLRHQQLATMGYFFTVQYLEQHLGTRQYSTQSLQDKAREYRNALSESESSTPYEVKSPKCFRPSSSRSEALLSGLPFNVHVSTMNVDAVDTFQANPSQQYSGVSFLNVTHGAPADHASGFGNILAGVTGGNVSGGLRRLETKRLECSVALEKAQNLLIAAVGNYIANARKAGPVNHIPARHAEIQALRWKVFECAHTLHHVTWVCSVRRVNVFSQSLGLAVSSYLASISDSSKVAAGWPDIWRRHGYLLSFEGLLSAAGKELGMIEDASVAIKMLRMVRVVVMPDTGVPSKAVGVNGSQHLRWVNLFATGQGSARQFLLQIGIDKTYYDERIPAPLKNGNAVQLYPLLFQVGVDIRQWGAHAGSNLMKQNGKQEIGGLVDDEDDDIGVIDDDVLVSLNLEALQKMNAYAHAISPREVLLDKVSETMDRLFSPGFNPTLGEREQLLPVHPSLSLLESHVSSSAGKMNHAILVEAATLAQQLGGGGLVFCKSGKDRTAMHVTYKQAQFISRYRELRDPAIVMRDAGLIRTYGVRLPICEKNVGQAKYAFNALQVRFMPEQLRPPMSVLKGFKFFGEGAIET